VSPPRQTSPNLRQKGPDSEETKTSPHERKAWKGSEQDQKTAHEESLLMRQQSSERSHLHRGGLYTVAPLSEAYRYGVLAYN
jgi:hypothetical protein